MYNAILNKISKVKESYPDPQCYFLALILAAEFGGTILYNNDHCVVEFEGRFFDKRGFVDPKEIKTQKYMLLEDFGWDIEKTLITAMLEKHGQK